MDIFPPLSYPDDHREGHVSPGEAMTRRDGNHPMTGRCMPEIMHLRRLDTFSEGARQLGARKPRLNSDPCPRSEFQGCKDAVCICFVGLLTVTYRRVFLHFRTRGGRRPHDHLPTDFHRIVNTVPISPATVPVVLFSSLTTPLPLSRRMSRSNRGL